MNTEIPDTVEPETFYGVCLEWDHGDTDTGIAISDRIFNFKRPKNLNVNEHGGWGCWSYYLVIQGPNKNDVRKFSEKVLRLLKRRGAEMELIHMDEGNKEGRHG